MKENKDLSNSQKQPVLLLSPLELLAKIKCFLQVRGVKGFVVGGYVRDSLLGRSNADIDIAVTASAINIAREFAQITGGRFVGLDETNAIARVVILPGHETVDFSTLRGSLENDLLCRDFTINAMALDLDFISFDSAEFPILDPWGGQQDMEKKLIKALTPHVFEDDPARLLRAVRLATEYGFSIESETEKLIKINSHLASQLVGERVHQELIRLLSLPHTAMQLTYMDNLGLLLALLPEMAVTRGATQPTEHFWDVFNHSLRTVEAAEYLISHKLGTDGEVREFPPLEISPLISQTGLSKTDILSYVPWSETLSRHFSQSIGLTPRYALLKLASLLHDIAKPKTRSIEPSGRIRFLGHAQEGVKIAMDILERLRFSNREIKLLEAMVLHHLRPTQMSQGEEMPSRRAIYRYFRDVGDAAIDILFLSLADHWATRGPKLTYEGWITHTDIVRLILEEHLKEESISRPVKLLDGNDIMAIFGLKPGPVLGNLLEGLKESQAAGDVTNREEAIAWINRQLTNP